jgi:hypothetical protein
VIVAETNMSPPCPSLHLASTAWHRLASLLERTTVMLPVPPHSPAASSRPPNATPHRPHREREIERERRKEREFLRCVQSTRLIYLFRSNHLYLIIHYKSFNTILLTCKVFILFTNCQLPYHPTIDKSPLYHVT